jgi:hypothetical protein
VLVYRATVTRQPSAKHLSDIVARRLCATLLCMLLFWAASCASAGGSHQSSSNDALITAEEIENSHQPTLYDVVRALRPNWLRSAPTAVRSDVESGISVYLDTQRAGNVDILRQMPSTSASSLRFYSASEAQSRFGLGNLHGVIQVVSAHTSR